MVPLQLRNGFVLCPAGGQPVNASEPYGEKLFGRKGRVPFPPDYSNISTSITRSSATEATLTVPPYRIAAPAAAGGGLIYYKQATSGDKTDIYAELYANGVALGASLSDYMLLGERDYNLGSGYSTKAGAGIIYNRRLAFLLNMENYHIFTWKGYDPEIDWSQADPGTLNIQGDAGNARLTIFSMKLAYLLMDKWNITLTNRYFSRRTNYRYYPRVDYSTYDLMLGLGIRI